MHLKLTALQNTLSPSPLTRINDPWLDQYAVELWLKRDDLIHPVISMKLEEIIALGRLLKLGLLLTLLAHVHGVILMEQA